MISNSRTLATLTLAALACFTATMPVQAEIHSQSKELIVMEPHDLPEQAQTPGNFFFLHTDTAGTTYLYVEQQQGAVLIRKGSEDLRQTTSIVAPARNS